MATTIRELRKRTGLSRENFAAKLRDLSGSNTTSQTIWRYEKKPGINPLAESAIVTIMERWLAEQG